MIVKLFTCSEEYRTVKPCHAQSCLNTFVYQKRYGRHPQGMTYRIGQYIANTEPIRTYGFMTICKDITIRLIKWINLYYVKLEQLVQRGGWSKNIPDIGWKQPICPSLATTPSHQAFCWYDAELFPFFSFWKGVVTRHTPPPRLPLVFRRLLVWCVSVTLLSMIDVCAVL